MTEDISKKNDIDQNEGQEVVPDLGSESGELEEQMPIKAPLRVLKCYTINKKFGWWAAVVLLESYAKKQICFYLWQKKDDVWKRKQKFGIHSKEDWQKMKKAVDAFADELS